MASLDSNVFNIPDILGKLNDIVVENNPGQSLRFSEPEEKENFGPYWTSRSGLGFSKQVSDILFASYDGKFLTLDSGGFACLEVNRKVSQSSPSEKSEQFDRLQIKLNQPLSFGKDKSNFKIRIEANRLRYNNNPPIDSIKYQVKVGPLWFRRDLSEVIRPEIFFMDGYHPVK
jgi:hypothetical protein